MQFKEKHKFLSYALVKIPMLFSLGYALHVPMDFVANNKQLPLESMWFCVYISAFFLGLSIIIDKIIGLSEK